MNWMTSAKSRVRKNKRSVYSHSAYVFSAPEQQGITTKEVLQKNNRNNGISNDGILLHNE